jgi:hypothetical protein
MEESILDIWISSSMYGIMQYKVTTFFFSINHFTMKPPGNPDIMSSGRFHLHSGPTSHTRSLRKYSSPVGTEEVVVVLKSLGKVDPGHIEKLQQISVNSIQKAQGNVELC